MLLTFVPAADDWEKRIRAFLTANPESTLLKIVLELWPDFLEFPPRRRAPTWFWTKEKLQQLETGEAVQGKTGSDGVRVWSVKS